MKKKEFMRKRKILKKICNCISFIGFLIILITCASLESVSTLILVTMLTSGILLTVGGLSINYKIEDAEEVEDRRK